MNVFEEMIKMVPGLELGLPIDEAHYLILKEMHRILEEMRVLSNKVASK